VWLLVRVPQRLLAGPAALAVGGWSSNALDRLGLHFWTAPGSVRGAVDFIPFHHCVYNVADFAIAGGTVFLLAAVGYALFTRRGRHGLRPASAHRRRRRPFARLALAGAASGLVAAAAFGAMHDTGVKSPVADRGSTMVRAR
jgi:hypothetical protein